MAQYLNGVEYPNCFGKSWDPSATECKGGINPAQTNPRTGGYLHDPCAHFQVCGERSKPGSNSLIPATSLSRAWQKPTGPVPQPSYTAPPQQTSPAIVAQQMQAQMASMQRQFAEAPRYGGHPTIPLQNQPTYPGYQQMMPVNFQIPAYLSEREHRAPGKRGFLTALGGEILRAMAKGGGHTLANFFDSTPFKDKPRE